MILVNTDYISTKKLEMLGLVKGSTIQSRNIGRDISQGFKTLVGGELKAYNEMMNQAGRWQRSGWLKKRSRWALMQSSTSVTHRLRLCRVPRR